MRVTIEARSEAALVEAFLRHAIQMVDVVAGVGGGEPAGLIGFRATAGDLAALLGAALEAAFGEAEGQGFAMRDVEVSGVMAIDDRCAARVRCWGTVEVVVANAARPAVMPRLHGVPTVRREGTMLIADVSLDAGEDVES